MRKLLIGLLALVLLLASLPLFILAVDCEDSLDGKDPNTIRDIATACETRIGSLQNQQKTLQSTIKLLDSQIRLTLAQISSTNAQIVQLQKDIATLSNVIEGLNQELDTLTSALDSIEKKSE